MDERYRHYGSNSYDPLLFGSIQNNKGCAKPEGGLWACDCDCDKPWLDYCQETLFKKDTKHFFDFTLPNANIYHIWCGADIAKLPQYEPKMDGSHLWPPKYFPDFEKMANQGIDAIRYHMSDYNSELYYGLYTWDVDCVLVLNPDKISIVE